MKAGNGGQVDPVGVGLVDEAGQEMKVRRWRGTEHRRDLGGDFRHLLTIPVGSISIERWSKNDL